MAITSTLAASSANDGGAFSVVGGAGFGSNVYVGGILTVSDTMDSDVYSTGSFVCHGGAGIMRNLNIGSNLNVVGATNVGGILHITNNTNSLDTDSGALIVAGGVGIGGDVTIKGNLTVTGTYSIGTLSISNATVDGTLNITGATTGSSLILNSTSNSNALVVVGGITIGAISNLTSLNVSGPIVANSTLKVKSTEAAINTTSGSLVLSGGLGAQGNGYFAGSLTALNFYATSVPVIYHTSDGSMGDTLLFNVIGNTVTITQPQMAFSILNAGPMSTTLPAQFNPNHDQQFPVLCLFNSMCVLCRVNILAASSTMEFSTHMDELMVDGGNYVLSFNITYNILS